MLTLGLQLILPYSGPPADGASLAVRRPRPIAPPLLPEYAAILHAPVFAPDRRPGEIATAQAAGAGGGVLAGYAALGSASGGAAATGVLSAPGGTTKTVRRGEALEGWRLVGVERTKLTFRRGAETRVLVIGAPAAVLGAAAPTAGAAPEATQ